MVADAQNQIETAAAVPAAPALSVEEKRTLGSFYTVGNPFVYDGFREWMRSVPKRTTFLEPFAGSGQIVKLLEEAGYRRKWQLFDKDESLSGVVHQDTIKNFPKGYRVAVSNPPYLSYHFAVRKGLSVAKEDFKGYASLYQTSIAQALANTEWLALIIPDSFATSGLFTERLEHVISLPVSMFDDTDMPTCLALWGPKESEDFKVWRCSQFLGTAKGLLRPLRTTACASRISFNQIDGQIGLRAIDGTSGPGIAFGSASICPDDKVKVSGRLLSRILITGIQDPDPVCAVANSLLAEWREHTADFALTAFKGTRDDGVFRRRLDFSNARALLSQAICSVEGHQHEEGPS
jgi:hypothetical protein